MQILHHGQIELLSLPDSWKEGPSRHGPWLEFERSFFPSEGGKAKLMLWYRGAPISDEGANRLTELMKKPNKILLPSELTSISETLDWMSLPETFRIMAARIDEINDRKVLVIEGRYLPEETDYYAVLLQNPGAAAYIQEIYFQAPKDDYPRFIRDAKTAIAGIQWVC